MFGFGLGEIVLILAVALIVLGPRKLPLVAKQLGRSLREFRRVAQDFQVTLEQEADAHENRERQSALAARIAPSPQPNATERTERTDESSSEETVNAPVSPDSHPSLAPRVNGNSSDRP